MTRHGTDARQQAHGIDSESAPPRPAVMSRFRMTVVCLALLLEGMSASSINVQVGAFSEDLQIGAVELQLVASAFLLSYAGLLPVAGRVVD